MGQVFREFPVNARDGALRSYLQAEKGARYQVRVRNTTGAKARARHRGRRPQHHQRRQVGARAYRAHVRARRLGHAGLRRLARQSRCHQRVLFHRLERLVRRGVRRPLRARRHRRRGVWRGATASSGLSAVSTNASAAPIRPARRPRARRRPKNPRAAAVNPPAPAMAIGASITPWRWTSSRVRDADSRHFIKYEWRDTLCRKHLIECGEKNRFWDESTLGFAPPPPRRR